MFERTHPSIADIIHQTQIHHEVVIMPTSVECFARNCVLARRGAPAFDR